MKSAVVSARNVSAIVTYGRVVVENGMYRTVQKIGLKSGTFSGNVPTKYSKEVWTIDLNSFSFTYNSTGILLQFRFNKDHNSFGFKSRMAYTFNTRMEYLHRRCILDGVKRVP